ncbi:MAG: alpha/beta fold hydrolase [Anaerolineae bacterium]|nr:alpha/beta fold hydrolase [Anaerolineae bacterium]
MLWRLLVCLLVCVLVIPPLAAPMNPALAQDGSGNGVGTFEETECPFSLPSGIVPGEDVICGFVTVPERHANPGGPTIRLAVMVAKGVGPNPAPDPVVFESGGPGFPSLASAASMFQLTGFFGGRDLVIVEQRGIYGSDPYLECDEGRDLVVEYYGQMLDIETTRALEKEALAACYVRLQNEGIDLSAYNSLENAADFPVVMDALGYDQFNYYGPSYASALGQHLMRDYPDRLRTVTLAALVPLSQGFMFDAPRNISRAFRLLFDTCASDPACNTQYPDLETVFFDLVDQFNTAPVTVAFSDLDGTGTVEVAVGGDSLVLALYNALYWTTGIPQIPARIYALRDGDYSLIRDNAGASRFGFRDVNAMQLSVMCSEFALDYGGNIDMTGVYPQVTEAMALYLDFGPVCEAWPVEPLPDYAFVPVESDIPTLLMSGEMDPVTPPENAEIVAQTLSHVYNYTLPATGHSHNDDCSMGIVRDFIDDPSQEPDAACLDDSALTFATSLGLGEIVMVPVTVSDYGLRTVKPRGWERVEPGVYAMPPTGQALFLAYTDTSLDAIREPFARFTDPIEELTINGRTWTLHNVALLGGSYVGVVALHAYDAGYYVVGVLGSSDVLDALVESVLRPALEALEPVG